MSTRSKEYDDIIKAVSGGFSEVARAKRARATHTFGVAARGRLQIADNPRFPKHNLLPAGRSIPVVIRHANVKGSPDDAIWDARGAALRLLHDANALEPGLHDFLMNTGKVFPTGTAAEFFGFFAASPGERSELVAQNPKMARAIVNAIKNPSSYCDLHYYTQIAYEFRCATGTRYWARFRLRPDDTRSDCATIDQQKLVPGSDFVPRQTGDLRPIDYLRSDFAHRVRSGGVRYRLELQFQPASFESRSQLDCSVEWNENAFPFHLVGPIELDQVIPNEDVEPLRFAPSNTHDDLTIVEAHDAADPASLAHLRSIVYGRASAVRPAPEQPKDQFVYANTAGQGIPGFDPSRPLPRRVQPTSRYIARSGLFRLPNPHPANPREPFIGVEGVVDLMGADLVKSMPANLTRLSIDKDGDDLFCDRRLNGFNAGHLEPVTGKPWRYEASYSTETLEKKPGGILPARISARFGLRNSKLCAHSIEHLLDGVTTVAMPGDENWDWAKKMFRSAEFVFQESQSHLATCHLNLEQYAMAYYRNIEKNPLRGLLEAHFEGTLHINQLGASIISGPTGIIAAASVLTPKAVDALIREGLSQCTWRWKPTSIEVRGNIDGNHFDRAALAMWGIVERYVDDFFERHEPEIVRCWDEVNAFSEDLVTHSILKPALGDLTIKDCSELKEACVYIIFHATFMHSWTNDKQWDDGGDPEYAALGLWDANHPDVKQEVVNALHASQVRLGWNLTQVHYNPIMETGPRKLKELLYEARNEIEPGLPISRITMSVNI